MNNQLKFKNGKFKIMQIADTQETASINPDTLKLITLAAEKKKPDLVVFTGDQIMGYSKAFGGDTFEKVKETITKLTEPLVKRGIPFCATFGNHDRDCGIANDRQMYEIYRNIPNFIHSTPRCGNDAGTYSVQIKNSKGTENIFNLYLIDSNAKEPDGTYSPVKKEQVKWYKEEREKIKAENGKYLPSLVFQHIPPCEIFDVIERCSRFKKGSVEAFYSHKNQYYRLSASSLKSGGFMHESPACPDINNGEFEAMKEKGEVLGIFFGHDHINSFTARLDGIVLGYTQCAGFNTYGPGAKRGARVFTLDEESTEKFETYTVTMDELCDFKPSRPVKEFILAHAPSSVQQVKKDLLRTALTGSAIALAAFGAKKILK